jgi:hypothetical protein
VARSLAKEIHVVLDNLSAHKTKDVERFLAEHPRVRFSLHPNILVVVKSGGSVVPQGPSGMSSPRGVFRPVADLGNKLRK